MHSSDDYTAGSSHRILFVSSTTIGGSGRSQRELARALVRGGCTVTFLVDDGSRRSAGRRVLEELTDASVRLSGRSLGRVANGARSMVGRRARAIEIDGVQMLSSFAPENAIAEVIDSCQPNVVVASSISRVTWRAVRSQCRQRGIRTVLYLREATAMGHLTAGLTPDLVVGNSETLVASAARCGVTAEFVPSVVRLTPAESEPSGDVALLVNPIESHGVSVIDRLAPSLPGVPFVLQESWPLDPDQQDRVDSLLRDHRNVSFRAYEADSSRIFRDARLLLAPHRIDNRPRTVLEAQVNGLPVVASDHPGLVEAVGDGGILIDRQAGPEAWIATLGELWSDAPRVDLLSARARLHAARPDIRPDHVVRRFMQLLDGLATPELAR